MVSISGILHFTGPEIQAFININCVGEIELYFKKFGFQDAQSVVIPSAVYFLPQPGEERILIGEAACSGPQTHPVSHSDSLYSNLKILFKSDLVKLPKELGHAYSYHKTLQIGESSAKDTTRQYLWNLWKNLKGLEEYNLTDTQLYIGKPAFPRDIEERYSKNIREIIKDLGFARSPVIVYEPYALFYYCRFGLGIPFQKEGGRPSNILILDHGGGTINTCIVQTNKSGALRLARPKAPQASAHGGSFLDQILLIRLIRAQNLPVDALFQIFTERSELKIVEKEQLLMQVERIKRQLYSTDCDADSRIGGIVEKHNIPGVPKPWRFSLTKKDVTEAFAEVWKSCQRTIAATLTTSGVDKIDFVILAGGTCNIGLHKAYLTSDFRDFLAQEVQFIDISHDEKPVSYGLAIQAVLDANKSGSTQKEIKPRSDENLSDYVARDLKVAIGTDSDEEIAENLYSLADEVVIPAGTQKSTVWETPFEKQINLRARLKRQLRYAFFMEKPRQQDPEDAKKNKTDSVEGEAIQIKKARIPDLERRIILKLKVNSEGRAKPQFFLAPTKAPKYSEPDHEKYALYIPDLEASRAVVEATAPAEESFRVVAIDFGTSNTCVCAPNIDKAISSIDSESPLIVSSPHIEFIGPAIEITKIGDFGSHESALRALKLNKIVSEASDRLFLEGHYKESVFEVLKVLESYVREKAGDPRDKQNKKLYGRPLMGKVFDADNPLISITEDSGMQAGYRDLFSGVIGVGRNMYAHEMQHSCDPWEALVWLGLANFLLKSIETENSKDKPE